MERVYSHNTLEVLAAENQKPVQTFAAQAADATLGVRSRPRCPHGRLDHDYQQLVSGDAFVEYLGARLGLPT